jgi:methylmalonyl-CoA mutase N-terminal domain/subunit
MAEKKRKIDLIGALSQWEKSILAETLKRTPERQEKFITASSDEVNRLYTPLDLQDFDYLDELGLPGEYPYTRAVHATGHRGRLWTMRQFAGFGSAEESNARYKYLLEQGSGGLSIAFDLPTLMGYSGIG